MRRLALIGSMLVLTGTGAAAIAGGPVLRPPLLARVVACETGPDRADRFAVFGGSMPSGPGVAAMAMRFSLYERRPGGVFRHVVLPHWDVWDRTARRGVPGFIFTKRLERLDAPAAFHAVVSFRSYDAAGRVLRSARRMSRDCRQPDPRPDLHIRRLDLPVGNGPTEVVVHNRGHGDAPSFRVSGRRAGVDAVKPVLGLPAGEQTTVALPLGACAPGQAVTVTLDADDQVDESNDANNVASVPCPA